MAFKNEYVPPLEQETSEFLKRAREILRTGHKGNADLFPPAPTLNMTML